MNEKSMSENDRNELQKRISEHPSIESTIDDEKAHAGPESNLKGFSSEHVHIVLRGYVDDISFKITRLLASHAVQICVYFFDQRVLDSATKNGNSGTSTRSPRVESLLLVFRCGVQM